MSKTYQALLKAEQLRAEQDPVALTRRMAHLEEIVEALRADLHAIQEQLLAMVPPAEAALADDDDDVRERIDRLELQHERLSTEPRRLADETALKIRQDLDRRGLELAKQFDQLASHLSEFRGDLLPRVDKLSRELADQQRHGSDLEQAQQTAERSNTEAIAALRDELTRALASAGPPPDPSHQASALAHAEAEREHQRLQTERLAELATALEHAVTRIAAVETLQRTESGQWRMNLRELETALQQGFAAQQHESRAAATSADKRLDELQASVGQLRGHLSHLTDRIERVHAFAEKSDRNARDTGESALRDLAALQQRIEGIEADGSPLRAAIAAAQAAMTRQLMSALADLQSQLVALQDTPARCDAMSTALSRAQATADAAERRIAMNEAAQRAERDGLTQRLDAIQADSESWRDVSVAVQAVLTQQQASNVEIEGLRDRIALLLDGQRRQQELLEELSIGPAVGAERYGDFAEPVELSTLRRQVVALQAGRLKLDAAIESRFEQLCEVLDAQFQAELEEIRGAVSAAPRKALSDAVARLASGLPGLRKKAR